MFEHLCKEKGGEVRRTVRFMERSVEHILDTIELLKTVPNFLPADNEAALFFDRTNVLLEVDDVGIILLEPGKQFTHCTFTFWDKRLRGREGLCRTVAEWAYEFYGLPLFAGINGGSKATLEFTKRLGFVEHSRPNGVVLLMYDPNYPE